MKVKKLKCYYVLSPEIWSIVPVLDFGQGPKEYYRCWTYVTAFTKREAKIKALREETMRDWIVWQRDDLKNPFSGLKVEEVEMKYCEEGDISDLEEENFDLDFIEEYIENESKT